MDNNTRIQKAISYLQKGETSLGWGLLGKKLTSDQLIPFFEELEWNTTLTELDLQLNCMDDRGTIALAHALQRNTTLTELDICDNPIGTRGAIALAQSLKMNTSLKKLDLCNNLVGKDGIIALIQSLVYNTSITRISYWLQTSSRH